MIQWYIYILMAILMMIYCGILWHMGNNGWLVDTIIFKGRPWITIAFHMQNEGLTMAG